MATCASHFNRWVASPHETLTSFPWTCTVICQNSNLPTGTFSSSLKSSDSLSKSTDFISSSSSCSSSNVL